MATKYVSSLTGEEMDAALIDMAYHNSEAYAVGTRNGVPVGSSDVTYHNNSKYWAEQVYGYTDRAEDAANRAEAAVPSGTAGAVFFDRAQTLTSAQQSQARANIMAGGSNRNLLDNPFFTVNQRSFTTGTNGAYFADRWKLSNTDLITATRNSDGTVTFTKTIGGTSTFIQHFIDRQTGLDEEATYTASLMDGDGNVYSVTEKFVPNTQSEKPVFINGMRVAIGLYGKGGQIWMGLYLQPASSGSFTLKAAKLELGEVSTLAQDAPPRYKSELDDCEYYCRTIEGSNYTAFGMATASNVVRVVLPFTMRAKPTPSLSGAAYLTGTGGTLTVSSITVNGWNDTSVELLCNVTGATANTPYLLWLAASAKIILSADL